MTLVFTILILALLLYLHRRQLREAERRGYIAGDYAASQRAARKRGAA